MKLTRWLQKETSWEVCRTGWLNFTGPWFVKEWKVTVLTDTPTEFELGDTATDIQRRREERTEREKKEAEKQQIDQFEKVESRRVETIPQLMQWPNKIKNIEK